MLRRALNALNKETQSVLANIVCSTQNLHSVPLIVFSGQFYSVLSPWNGPCDASKFLFYARVWYQLEAHLVGKAVPLVFYRKSEINSGER